MPYLIDGHNLIPHFGLSLASLDDELILAQRLSDYCRITRKNGIEIYFDNAQPGGLASQSFGLIKIHFVRRPQLADDAIRQRLIKLAKAAKNWIVISSDRQVQAEARSRGAQVLPSDKFALQVMEALRVGLPEDSHQTQLTESEIQNWLDEFNQKKN